MSDPARYYSSTAIKTTITGSINTTAVSITLASSSGYPTSYPFSIVLEKDSANEEIINVTALVGTAYTVARGFDGTTARSHSAGTSAEHAVSAKDFTDFRSHEAAAANVHDIGATSSVVGTLTTQTLSNKTLGTDLAAGGFKVTGVADPTLAQDAATKNWAETAMTSQLSAATTQATNSANSATDSANSATASAGSASDSSTSADASQVSRLASETAETNAETAETNAETAETNASGSASTATTQAGTATTQAGIATTQAGTATTQAGVATTKAGESATSATASSDSATASAGSATSSASSYDSFSDRYIVASSAPTTDPDGDALISGALWWNSSANQMNVWNGSAWQLVDTASGISPSLLDAKGDLIAATADDTAARLAVGTDGYVLTADTAEATGLKWAVAASPVDDPFPTVFMLGGM